MNNNRKAAVKGFDKLKSVGCLILFAIAIVVCMRVVQGFSSNASAQQKSPDNQSVVNKSSSQEDTSDEDSVDDNQSAVDNNESNADEISEVDKIDDTPKHNVEVVDGVTYIDGILIVNKSYGLPTEYNPGINDEAQKAFDMMAEAAANENIYLYVCSGFRSYWTQSSLYNGYVSQYGQTDTDTFSARPGFSEHQTGLAFDVNRADDGFKGTPEAIWLAKNCADYGFIIRYQEGKESKTGFKYEPWHIRYLGVELAQEITDSGLCLEEYMEIESYYIEDDGNY